MEIQTFNQIVSCGLKADYCLVRVANLTSEPLRAILAIFSRTNLHNARDILDRDTDTTLCRDNLCIHPWARNRMLRHLPESLDEGNGDRFSIDGAHTKSAAY